jgi:hypothetical protein
MPRSHQGRFVPAAVRDVVVERRRDLWLAAFRRQLEVMRDDVRHDYP